MDRGLAQAAAHSSRRNPSQHRHHPLRPSRFRAPAASAGRGRTGRCKRGFDGRRGYGVWGRPALPPHGPTRVGARICAKRSLLRRICRGWTLRALAFLHAGPRDLGWRSHHCDTPWLLRVRSRVANHWQPPFKLVQARGLGRRAGPDPTPKLDAGAVLLTKCERLSLWGLGPRRIAAQVAAAPGVLSQTSALMMMTL
eukprot:1236363-Rhodomonas_salina.1